MDNKSYINNDELMHYGVLGMKWGVKRSEKQLARAKGKVEKLKAKKKEADKLDRTKKKLSKAKAEEKYLKEYLNKRKTTGKEKVESMMIPKKKTVKDLSDAELKNVVARLELEKRYKDLNPKQVSSGKKFIDDVLIPSATSSGKQVLSEYLTKAGKKALGLSTTSKKYETPDSLKELEDLVKRLNLEKRLEELKG